MKILLRKIRVADDLTETVLEETDITPAPPVDPVPWQPGAVVLADLDPAAGRALASSADPIPAEGVGEVVVQVRNVTINQPDWLNFNLLSEQMGQISGLGVADYTARIVNTFNGAEFIGPETPFSLVI